MPHCVNVSWYAISASNDEKRVFCYGQYRLSETTGPPTRPKIQKRRGCDVGDLAAYSIRYSSASGSLTASAVS
ncbi:hypothetical protein Y032_0360g3458 [Ancylostoma ceylanicum]|uniref:Uncharacterized protein n=1 Tax=Ancylostoma ceylanicum TaxID=53326 RepID=A0A016RVP1_9BILA|nr:hypothetical protein Y032_0360g3458 [Ancylostoma ceylanicum]